MRFLGVAAAVFLVALAVRLQMQPPDPELLRSDPAAVLPEPADRGRQVYERYGCAQCHGKTGAGGFANRNAETAGQVPGLLFVKEGYTAQELRRKILDGVPNVGKQDPAGVTPPYRMPGWAGQMTEAEASDLVEYLMSLYPKSADDAWR